MTAEDAATLFRECIAQARPVAKDLGKEHDTIYVYSVALALFSAATNTRLPASIS